MSLARHVSMTYHQLKFCVKQGLGSNNTNRSTQMRLLKASMTCTCHKRPADIFILMAAPLTLLPILPVMPANRKSPSSQSLMTAPPRMLSTRC